MIKQIKIEIIRGYSIAIETEELLNYYFRFINHYNYGKYCKYILDSLIYKRQEFLTETQMTNLCEMYNKEICL